jgi:hypothetical protein
MKKTLLFSFLLLSFFTATAQVTVKPGVRAGLNLATLTNTNSDSKADFYLGGFMAINLTRIYTLQPEINYSRQGAKSTVYDYALDFDPIATPVGREANLSVQYLSLSVMNKFKIIKGFHAAVGPTLDFRVGDNFRDFTTERPSDLDVGINFGLGYTLPMGLTLEARYKAGFIDIFGENLEQGYYDNDNNSAYDDTRLNSILQFGLSYAF